MSISSSKFSVRDSSNLRCEDSGLVQESTEEEATGSNGCGILGRYPLISAITFALAGVGVGVGLSFWNPDDEETKKSVLTWIGLIGDLFVRSLKLVILPLVFINVVISVVDMMNVGRAGSIGWKTILLYTITTLVAAIAGIVSIITFKGLFTQGVIDEEPLAYVRLGCGAEGMYLTENDDFSISCSYDETPASEFAIDDINGTFSRANFEIEDSKSLSDTIYEGVFTKIFADNLTEAFNESNFAAVVFFAIVFGVALSNVILKKEGNSNVMGFLSEMDQCFINIIHWIITITPFAVFSLIAKAIGEQSNLTDDFENVGYLVLASSFGFLIHHLLVHQLMFYLITKWNPFTYLKCLIPAQTMAFACASSAATMPVTMESVRSTGRVPESILKFVVPLGATVNMDGSAVYFPCACVWLAVLNGIDVNVGHYILLAIIASIGSAGTAPVPAAGLVLIITAYNTVFGTTGTPAGFSFIVAIDFLMDRMQTTMNITGDAMVCGMIAKLCANETITETAQDNKDDPDVTVSTPSSSNDEDEGSDSDEASAV